MHTLRSAVFPAAASLILAGALAVPALAATAGSLSQPGPDGTAASAAPKPGKSADAPASKAAGPSKDSAEASDHGQAGSAKDAGSAPGTDTEKADLSAIPEESVITVDELYEMLGGEGLDKAAKTAAAKDSSTSPDNELAVIDIRSLATYSELHVPGAKCVPAGRVFEIRLREVPRDATVVLIDKDGSRLVETWQTLLDNDYDPEKVLVVEGGMDAWFAADYPAEETPIRLGC